MNQTGAFNLVKTINRIHTSAMLYLDEKIFINPKFICHFKRFYLVQKN